MTLSEIILLEEDEVARTRRYARTPLDFASREIWSLNLVYHYLMNILNGMRRQHWQRKMEKSVGRRSDNDVLPVEGVAHVIGVLFAVAFLGTNFIAWNSHFPTPTDRLLWRISSIGLMAIGWVGGIYATSLYSDSEIKVMQKNIQQHRRALEDQRLLGKE